jgi:hypothetical protein
MQVRYQGVDWRDHNNWGCNEERNPYGSHYLDGASLEAMEVMFVKVKQRLVDLDWSYPLAATQYDKWTLAREMARYPSLAAHMFFYFWHKPAFEGLLMHLLLM